MPAARRGERRVNASTLSTTRTVCWNFWVAPVLAVTAGVVPPTAATANTFLVVDIMDVLKIKIEKKRQETLPTADSCFRISVNCCLYR